MLNTRRGLFGTPPNGQTGILPGDQPAIPQTPSPAPQEPVKKGGGFFGEGGAGRAIAGSIGDALLQMNGMRPVYAQAMQQQMAAKRQQQEQQQQWQQWVAQQEYKRANPDPTTLEQNVGAFQNFTPEQRAAYAQMQEAQQGPVTLTLPGNRVYSGPRSGLGAALGGVATPTAPVGKLTPIEPTIRDTPAPQIGASGMPQMLTQQQYQATVQAMGKDKTDAWMLRNGIRIGN